VIDGIGNGEMDGLLAVDFPLLDFGILLDGCLLHLAQAHHAVGELIDGIVREEMGGGYDTGWGG